MAAVAGGFVPVIGKPAGSATGGIRVTDLGRDLLPVLDDLHPWGERQADFNSASR